MGSGELEKGDEAEYYFVIAENESTMSHIEASKVSVAGEVTPHSESDGQSDRQ